MTFRQWLKRQLRRTDPVGDLAGDALADAEWRGWTVVSLWRELARLGASAEAFAALDRAAAEWRQALRPAP